MASLMDDEDTDLWEHSEAAKKITAQYANRIFSQPLGEGMVRITFGEMTETIDPVYHTSIVVTPELALEFAEVIHRVASTVIRARSELAEAERTFAEQGASSAAEGAARSDGN